MRQSRGDAERGGWPLGGALVSAFGVLLCVWYARHLVTSHWAEFGHALYVTVAPSVIAVGITAGGIWTAFALPSDEQRRVLAWCLLGGATFAAFGVLLFNYQLAHGVAVTDSELMLTNAGSIGAAAGLVVGLYDVWGKRANRRVADREADLQRERDRLRTLFANLPNPALRFRVEDGEPVIEETNAAFGETFGYDESAVVGAVIDDLIVPRNRTGEAADIAVRIESGETVRERVRRETDSGVREFLLIVIPIRVAETTTGHAILIDVTERERYVQRLEVFNRVLRHDLRNDANVILGHAETLITETEGNNAVTEHARTIHRRAAEMVERGDRARRLGTLLDGDAGQERIDLAAMLDEQADALRAAHPEATVEMDVPTDLYVRGGPLLSEAFSQLLANAVEHNDRDRPTVTVRATETDDGWVCVTVCDDGPGIPDRERAVFDRGRETPLEHSLGMGLWLAHWVVDAGDGSLDIEDREPRGTRIRVRLPGAE